jgi:hypothetical protein
MIKYLFPDNWIKYNPSKIAENLTTAKAAVMSLSKRVAGSALTQRPDKGKNKK